jgi:asparagine synthase (glutamine-hydrolysing)
MCGIAGAVSVGRGAAESLPAMLRALRRRGPDSEGVYTWPGAAFGHRRLAIFDLSDAGAQPMLTPDGATGVVFNGAIYNFLELRAELARGGYAFRSHTDTEILLAGYRAWGIDRLVERCQGMFAFALWDAPGDRLFLVRDRLGVKPLVYVQHPDGGLSFASTVRALRAAGAVSELSPAGMADFLQDGFVGEGHTIYSGAQKLAPATILEWSAGQAQQRTYWRPPMATAGSGVTFEDAVQETERLLLRAVERRLHADVPVAALLSAGIDSSLVCWAVATLGGDVTAFTISAPGHPSDETAPAVQTARALGIRHEILSLSDADEPDVAALSAAYPEPFACSSALGMLRLSRAIAGTPARVFLTGDGGDDLFLGYQRHRLLFQVERAARRMPGGLAAVWRAVRSPGRLCRGRTGCLRRREPGSRGFPRARTVGPASGGADAAWAALVGGVGAPCPHRVPGIRSCHAVRLRVPREGGRRVDVLRPRGKVAVPRPADVGIRRRAAPRAPVASRRA